MWKSLIIFLLFPWCLGKVLMPSHMRLPNFSLYGSRCPNACFWHRLAQLLARLRSRCIMLRTRKFRPWPSALSEFIVVLQCAAYLFDHMRSIWQHDERSFFWLNPVPVKSHFFTCFFNMSNQSIHLFPEMIQILHDAAVYLQYPSAQLRAGASPDCHSQSVICLPGPSASPVARTDDRQLWIHQVMLH